MKVLILYPNTPAAGMLGVRLLELGHSVSVFCPEKIDFEIGGAIIDELEIVGNETDLLRGVQNSFTVIKELNFSDFRIIVIPCLDVQPEQSDEEYAAMCKHLFRNFVEMQCNIDADASIIFGWNYSGLLAAREFGNLFPEHKEQILITSSVFSASVRVFGPSVDLRAIPIARSPVQLVYTSNKCRPMMKAVERNWDIDTFPVLEHRALWEVLSTLTKERDLSSAVEIIGRYPTKVEAENLDISAESPVWLPAGSEYIAWFEEFLRKNKMYFVTSSGVEDMEEESE